jgi:hypothetical protein
MSERQVEESFICSSKIGQRKKGESAKSHDIVREPRLRQTCCEDLQGRILVGHAFYGSESASKELEAVHTTSLTDAFAQQHRFAFKFRGCPEKSIQSQQNQRLAFGKKQPLRKLCLFQK